MYTSKIKVALPLGFVLIIFLTMMLYSGAAVEGAKSGLDLCAQVIAPTLLPFFVLSNLLCALGLPGYLGRGAEGLFRRMFGVGGSGAAAFVLGLTSGYPLGASSVAELYRSGSVSKAEASKLLMFCNNTGPAFIIGMAGVGVFRSSAIGVLLFAIHAVAAAMVGCVLCRGEAVGSGKKTTSAISAMSLSPAITDSMLRAVKSTAIISGFVIFFSMLTALMCETGLFTLLTGFFCECTPMSIGQSESLIMGIMELGSGIASLGGLQSSPGNLALAAFILGWGGISVQFQTVAVLSQSGLKYGAGIFGKLLHGALSAVLAFVLGAAFL